MSRSLIIAAALTALVAAPAAAAAAAAAAGEAQSTPAKQSKPAAQKSKETKYCLTYEAITGSRTEKTECRTRAQWAKEGIDVDKPNS